MFTGVEVTLADLGLAGRAAAEREPAKISATRVACPECDGALELRAPDRTERVGCPYCGALLDVNQGNLVSLKSVANERPQPLIRLGATGAFSGTTYTVIGYLVRAVTILGTSYTWEEWLLYEPAAGFRWLVCSDGHWSFVEPLAAGDVDSAYRTCRFRGKTYKMFQGATARVEQVLGELYWRVEAGEKAFAEDYVAPPCMISVEKSASGSGGTEEVAFSLGTYVEPREVERIFGVKTPRPTGVAPNQPWPHAAAGKVWAGLTAATIALALILGFAVRSGQPLSVEARFEPLATSAATAVWFSEPFTVAGGKNIVVELGNSGLSNAWFYAQGDMVNADTGLVVDFSTELEYYDGEGDWRDKSYLSAVPAGEYALRLEAQWSNFQQPQTVSVLVTQGRFRGRDLIVLVALLAAAVMLFYWQRASFERRRWENAYTEGQDDAMEEDDE